MAVVVLSGRGRTHPCHDDLGLAVGIHVHQRHHQVVPGQVVQLRAPPHELRLAAWGHSMQAPPSHHKANPRCNMAIVPDQ